MALTAIGEVPQWGGVADWSSCRTPLMKQRQRILSSCSKKLYGGKTPYKIGNRTCICIHCIDHSFWSCNTKSVKKVGEGRTNANVVYALLDLEAEFMKIQFSWGLWPYSCEFSDLRFLYGFIKPQGREMVFYQVLHLSPLHCSIAEL